MNEDTLIPLVRKVLDAILQEAGVEARAYGGARKDSPFGLEITARSQGDTHRLMVDVKPDGQPRFVLQAIGGMMSHSRGPNEHLVVAAPRIGPGAAEICRKAGVGYVDLDGNCWLRFGGVLISKQVPSSPSQARHEVRAIFSPKSSRVARILLQEPLRVWSQNGLARECNLSPSHVNLVIRRMMGLDLVVRDGHGSFLLKDRDALLEAWKKAYDFKAHAAHELYTPLEPEAFIPKLHAVCSEHGWRYALTLFAGAQYVAPHVRFNRVHAYFDGDILGLMKALDLKSVSSGANVVLLKAVDEYVFRDIQDIPHTACVASDIQLQLDLSSVESRGEEAAAFHKGQRLSSYIPRFVPEQESRLREFLRLRDEGDTALKSGLYGKACDAFRHAMDKVKGLEDGNLDFHKKSAAIKWWLSALNRAYEEQSVASLKEARRVYAAYDVQAGAESIRFNAGEMRLGDFLTVALASRTPDCRDREKREGETEHWFKVVTARFSEGSAELRGRAEEIMAWFRSRQMLKG
jgi:hypothetical protein